MAYATLLGEENTKAGFMCILKPRRKQTGFTLVSGSVYSVAFDYGELIGVTIDGIDLAMGTSPILSAGQFYFNPATKIVYVRCSDSSNPNSHFVVFNYELFFISSGAGGKYWNRVPDDQTTRTVFFEPLIKKSPEIKENLNDSLFGFLPVQTSSIQLINTDHFLERHIYDGSFNKASISVYHVFFQGPRDTILAQNIKLVYDGFTGNVTFQDANVNIVTTDRVDIFSPDFSGPASKFYTTSLFPSLDPNSVLQPIRYVYGVVDNFVPVNVSYVDQSPANTDNRVWGVLGEQVNLGNLSRLVPASPSSTTTRTYVSSAQGFMIGDSVHFDRASGTDEYFNLTNVNYVSNYVEHAALAMAMTAGDSLRRSFVGNVTLVQGGVTYKPQFSRDYTTSGALAGGSSGFTFTSSMEANLGISVLDPTIDRLFIRVYGRTNDVTLGGPGFGTNDAVSGNLANPIVVLLDLMKKAGLTESEIDSAGFIAALALTNDAVGFAIPSTASAGFPSFKEIIIKLIGTSLIKVSVNDDNEWTVSLIKPLGVTPTKVVGDDEFGDNTVEYVFDYKELISDFIVKYAVKEVSDDPNTQISTNSQVISVSNVAKFLHGVDKQKSFDSLHFKTVDAQKLADRLAFYFGDRLGKLSFQVKNRFFDSVINDNISVTRTRLPGYSFDNKTMHARKFAVSELSKSLKSVQISADDQKGIEDNSGSW